MIDEDAEGGQRANIVKLVKERFGYEHVLNSVTFTTEKSRSSVITACKALGVENAQNILDKLPNDKGQDWDLKDAILGNESKNREIAKDFVAIIEKTPHLKETMLGVQGIISGRSQHASGIFVSNDVLTSHNAVMKTKSELFVTQFDAEDSEEAGAIKFDFLSVNAMDRIRATMELLLQKELITWQGSLRATYNKYFHPDTLDLTSPEMYQMLFDGEVVNAFQFETMVGRQALESINARSFDEIAAANALMRLSAESGEQPIDKYIRFKKNISDWYTEMTEQGLTLDEQEVLNKQLSSRYGICDTQEALMELSMDKSISGFSLLEANKLRKSVAKKNPELQEAQKIIFYEHGKTLGTTKTMLDYVWNYCLKISFGYAFSKPHISGYSLVLMIEMNACFQYGTIYWKTACLSVNAGILVGDIDKGIDYAAVAKAVANMDDLVINPDINQSQKGFYPVNEKILYGLGSINGVNRSDIKGIIDNRPYKNTQELIDRTEISPKKVVALIKSGAFDNINSDRRELMIEFVSSVIKEKNKLTTSQLSKIINDVPIEYEKYVKAYMFKGLLFGKNKVIPTPEIEKEFLTVYYPMLNTMNIIDSFSYDDNGLINVDKKKFIKWFNKYITPLKDWLKTDEATKAEAGLRRREFWIENCLGNTQSWEMETLTSYIGEHELNVTNIAERMDISNFSELPKEPVITRISNNGFKSYRPSIIMGTVIDKDKKKGITYIIASDGSVVNVRLGKKRYGDYNQKVMQGVGEERKCIDDTWFKRGTKLICVGYRRGNDFVINKNGSGLEYPLMKVNGYDMNVTLQTEKLN